MDHCSYYLPLQNKEDASELMAQKDELEKRKKAAEDAAVQKELERDRKIRTIGNYVHESVPVSNNEVNNHRGV
jgi:seryl-tRNA synthetase